MSPVRFWSAVIGAGTGILFVIVLLVHAALRSVARTSALYRKHVADTARERAFLASAAFFVTVVSVRLITLSIHLGLGGFRDISVAGTHVHHLVWGILLLLIIGYLWLLRIGAGDTRWRS